MGWNEDLELSKKAIIYQNQIYNKIFDNPKIIRFNKNNDERHILDTEYHIDVQIELQNGIKLTGQEKALRHEFSKYNTFTLEFYQNRHTKERGEFFNLCSQFYLHAYWNKNYTGFEKWCIIKIFEFLEWLKQKDIRELEKYTKASTSKASFLYIDYLKLPSNCFYRNHNVV